MKKCFVVQPFDGGIFDQRYKEIFEPAIKAANLEPYRVDSDLSVEVPIEEIHRNINDCAIVLVEITTDNPNVWYELGYSMAKNKTIVMVCSDERITNYPFDIRHRTIVNYKTKSLGDYTKLVENITMKLTALLNKEIIIDEYEPSVLVEGSDISPVEKVVLAIVMANQITDEESYNVYMLQKEMSQKGYNDLGANFAVRKLITRKFLLSLTEEDYNGNHYTALKLTENGIAWMLEHEHDFVIKIEKKEDKLDEMGFVMVDNDFDDEDIPF